VGAHCDLTVLSLEESTFLACRSLIRGRAWFCGKVSMLRLFVLLGYE